MDRIFSFLERYISLSSIPKMTIIDVIEIIIIAVLIYGLLTWVRDTRAWALMRGIVVILVFITIAYLFQMNTILWIVKNASVVAITALIVVFQPELRKALETLGQQNVLSALFKIDPNGGMNEEFSEETISEIIKASYEMGKVRTGALIVVERSNSLTEFTKTGIDLDALVTSQLLINIFEHNTPLHDGAVIISGNRVVSATCYLPLSDNRDLSKELGTRHRAGVGISEVTDSVTVIVSEETGRVSVAENGQLFRNVTSDFLREKLSLALVKPAEEKKFFWQRGRSGDEETSHK